MKFLFSALVLIVLSVSGCTASDTCEGVDTTSDVVSDTTAQMDVSVETMSSDAVDSTSDVSTVEEED
tara:strand:+ start:521 stop:721 length:201 start_codon:yes stop_codon:yes gene_type:complete